MAWYSPITVDTGGPGVHLVHPAIQDAKLRMAVGMEWTYPECGSKAKGCTVAVFSRRDLRRGA